MREQKNSPKQKGRRCATDPIGTPRSKYKPPVQTFKPSRPSQATNCFEGTCGRCRDCQKMADVFDPDVWFGGS